MLKMTPTVLKNAKEVLLNPQMKEAYDTGSKRLNITEYFAYQMFYRIQPF